jgi:hypothetical protein
MLPRNFGQKALIEKRGRALKIVGGSFGGVA